MDTESSCAFDGGCPLFEGHLSRLPGMADLFRRRYCDGNHDACARHLLAVEIGADAVPDALMPNDHDGAHEVKRGSN